MNNPIKTTYFILALISGGVSILFAILSAYKAPGGSGAACGFAITAGLCILASAITKDIDHDDSQ
jgi:hypothetical protein